MQQQSDDKITDPIRHIEEDHAWQLVLCDALEKIADSLPNNIDQGLIAVSGEALTKVISQHNRMEEKVLFPLLAKRTGNTNEFSDHFVQLCREHVIDEAFALEIAEEFEQFTCNGAQKNPEMLGYMLRGFFVSLRRHIIWENQTVLPRAREILGPDDLEELRQWIRTHPEMSRCRHLLKSVGKCLGRTDSPYGK